MTKEINVVAESNRNAVNTFSPFIESSIILIPKINVGRYNGIAIKAIIKLPRLTQSVRLAAIAPMKLSAGVPINKLSINQPYIFVGRFRVIAKRGDRIVKGRPVVNQ